jgi:maltose-binding protein MalE
MKGTPCGLVSAKPNNRLESRISPNLILMEEYMKTARVIAITLAAILCLSVLSGVAMAEDKIKVKGIIVTFDLDERTVTVDVDGQEMTFYVENDIALFKLDDRLWEEDEVKIKYVVEGDKMVIKEANDMKGSKPGC